MNDHSETTSCSRPITVLGCGLMGTAIARTLSDNGFSVTAWNRTHAKAQALEVDGVRAATTVADAVAGSDLAIVCVANTDAVRAALSQVDDWSGVTVVNVTSGTPDDASALDSWVTTQSGAYLEGTIACYPSDIGDPHALLCYSGQESLFDQHRSTLARLGMTHYLSANIRSCNVLLAWWGSFYGASLSAYIEAVAYAISEGVTTDELLATTPMATELITHTVPQLATAIGTGDHITDQATLDTFLDASRLCLNAMHSAGHNANILTAAYRNMLAASDAGLGSEGLSVQSTVLGPQ